MFRNIYTCVIMEVNSNCLDPSIVSVSRIIYIAFINLETKNKLLTKRWQKTSDREREWEAFPDLKPWWFEEFGDAITDFCFLWWCDDQWVQSFFWELSLQRDRDLLPGVYHPLQNKHTNKQPSHKTVTTYCIHPKPLNTINVLAFNFLEEGEM